MVVADSKVVGAWEKFLRAHAAVIDRLEEELQAEQGLPLPWYEVLLHLSRAPGGRLRMQDLARQLLLSRSGLTRLTDRMEASGLVRRESCPSDRRGTFAVMTDTGARRLREAAPVHLRGIREHFGKRLQNGDVDALLALLDRLLT